MTIIEIINLAHEIHENYKSMVRNRDKRIAELEAQVLKHERQIEQLVPKYIVDELINTLR